MLIRVFIASLVLGLSALVLQAAPRAERIELYYGMAEGNYLIGDLSGAERGIEQILRLNPDSISALNLLARVRLQQKRPQEALEIADRMIALEPENPEHPLFKALLLGQMDRREAATQLIGQVLADTATGSEHAAAARQLLGLLRMAGGEWDQAAATFQEIYLNDPDSAEISLRLSSEAYLEKARSALQAGEQDKAIAAIDQSIALYRDQDGKEALQRRTALRLMRARLLAQFGRVDTAITDLQALTGQQPDNFEALITLASLYASVDRWASLEGLLPSIAARPELQDVALYLEGRAALAKNRVGTARAKFEAAINALPNDADNLRRSLFFYRGICLEMLGRQAEAEVSILNAIDAGFRPETGEEALISSRTLLRAKRAEEAIPILEAITLNRIAPDAEVWAMLGRAHLASGTPALALSALNEALQIDPRQAENRALRGSLLRQIGDLDGALADYQTAARLSPADASIAYAKGLVHLQLGQIPEAEQALARAAATLPEPAGLQLLHALLAHTLGQTEAAEASLLKYQTAIPEKRNQAARYLAYLLGQTEPGPEASDEVSQYIRGDLTRKQALDTAGRAQTPELARRQICATAFWMAQHAHRQGEPDAYQALLKIAVNLGHPDLTEFQLAKWQLEQTRPQSTKQK